MVKRVEKLWIREGFIPSNNCVMKSGQSQKQKTLPLKITSMVKRLVGHQHLGQVTRGQHGQVTRGQHAVEQITRGQHQRLAQLTRGQHRLTNTKCGAQGFQQVTRGQYKAKQNILRSSSDTRRHHYAVPGCRLPHHNHLGDSVQQEEQDRVMLVYHAAGTYSPYCLVTSQ